MNKYMLVLSLMLIVSACTKKQDSQKFEAPTAAVAPAETPVEPAPAPTPEASPTPSTPGAEGGSSTPEGTTTSPTGGQATESAPNL